MFLQAILLIALAIDPSPHHKYGLTEAMPKLDGAIRIATYNVLNLFDHKNDPTLEGEYDDFGDNPGPTSLERCEELAKAIRKVDADIITLQEVESLEALNWFNNTFLSSMGYKYIASEEAGYYRGVEQSVLSRYPITHTQVWPNLILTDEERVGPNWSPVPGKIAITFQRSPLCATIQTPDGYEITLFVVHHKAGRSNNWHREYESLKIMRLVEELEKKNPSQNIAVLGDFNAAPWDKSVKVYLQGGMVDTMQHRSTNVGYDEDAPLYKTHTSNRIIDFILLNPNAMSEFVPNSGFILGTSAEEYDWRNESPPSGYASDHYPLAIDLVPKENMRLNVKANPWPKLKLEHSRQQVEPENLIPISDAEFIASKRSQVFHDASCGNAQGIKESNQIGFESYDDAFDSGRKPAGCCKPSK